MKEMTVRIPDHYKARLAAVAKEEGQTPAEFVRQRIIKEIELAERRRHRTAMEAMVRQAIENQEIRDPNLEEAALEAIAGQKS
jgi:predicted DNA-binding protein